MSHYPILPMNEGGNL